VGQLAAGALRGAHGDQVFDNGLVVRIAVMSVVASIGRLLVALGLIHRLVQLFRSYHYREPSDTRHGCPFPGRQVEM